MFYLNPFYKLCNLKINTIINNDYHNSIIFTNGTDLIKKGFYKWFFFDNDLNSIFNLESLIIIENINKKFNILIKVKEFDNLGILIDDDTYILNLTKDICYNYTDEILKGTHTIKKTFFCNNFSPNLIIDDNKIISYHELENIFQKDPNLILNRFSVIYILKNIILNFNKNIYTTNNSLEKSFYNKLSDCTLIFYDKNGISVNYHCHIKLLCLKSYFFYKLINSSEKYKSKNIIIEIKLPVEKEINNLDVCKSVFDFFYKNKLNLKINNSIDEMNEYFIDFYNIVTYFEIKILDESITNLYNDILEINNLTR